MFAKVINDVGSVEMAEAQAVRAGVELAVEKGIANIVIEVDFQIVYWALQRSKEDISYFGGIIADVLVMSNKFESCSFNWVRRSANKIAHELAQFAYSCASFYCSPTIPEVILYAVNADFPAS